MLVGTGISLIGSKAGWDPRLTALASMAGGGIAGGAMSGAFGSAAGSAAGAAGPGVGMTGSLFPAGTTAGTATLGGMTQPAAGGLFGGSTPSVIGSSAPGISTFSTPGAGGGYFLPGAMNKQGILPFGRGGWLENSASLSGVTQPSFPGASGQSGFSKWITGPKGKALGADMLKTFLDYEIALANQEPQRLSGGGGGGGGGLTAYPGGGGQGNKQVVWGFGDIGKSFKPQPLV